MYLGFIRFCSCQWTVKTVGQLVSWSVVRENLKIIQKQWQKIEKWQESSRKNCSKKKIVVERKSIKYKKNKR